MRVHRQTQARPIDRHAEELPHLIPLPAQPYDVSEVVYRTVDAEGFVVYRQNFYAAPWRLLGQNVAVRVTENELVIHDRAFIEATRHPLFPRGVAGQRRRRRRPTLTCTEEGAAAGGMTGALGAAYPRSLAIAPAPAGSPTARSTRDCTGCRVTGC